MRRSLLALTAGDPRYLGMIIFAWEGWPSIAQVHMTILVILGMIIFAWPYEAVLVSVAIGALESTGNDVEIGIDQLDRFF